MGYTRARTIVKRTVRLVDRHEEHVDERHHEGEQQLVHRAGCNSGGKAHQDELLGHLAASKGAIM